MDITIEKIAERLNEVFPGGAMYKTRLTDKYRGEVEIHAETSCIFSFCSLSIHLHCAIYSQSICIS